jgi:hypothetical protein
MSQVIPPNITPENLTLPHLNQLEAYPIICDLGGQWAKCDQLSSMPCYRPWRIHFQGHNTCRLSCGLPFKMPLTQRRGLSGMAQTCRRQAMTMLGWCESNGKPTMLSTEMPNNTKQALQPLNPPSCYYRCPPPLWRRPRRLQKPKTGKEMCREEKWMWKNMWHKIS